MKSLVITDEGQEEELRLVPMEEKPIATINSFILHPSSFT
jgi:hypothetical protein